MADVSKSTLLDIRSIYRQALGRTLQEGDSSALVYAHFGDFNSGKIDCAIRTTEGGLFDAGSRRSGIKRTCNTLIECLQNISSHSAKDENGRMNAFALVTTSEENDRIICGNLLLADDMPVLDEKLKSLKALDRNEIRKLFIETLCNDDFNDKGGAGLGLMTIAKKAENRIGYSIQQLDDNFAYFVIDLKITH